MVLDIQRIKPKFSLEPWHATLGRKAIVCYLECKAPKDLNFLRDRLETAAAVSDWKGLDSWSNHGLSQTKPWTCAKAHAFASGKVAETVLIVTSGLAALEWLTTVH